MQYQRALCWIRRDLRLSDHAALAAATRSSERVFVVFVFDTTLLNPLEDRDDRRLSFIAQSLEAMQRALRDRGSDLIVRHGDPADAIPELVHALDADALFFNRDYEPRARQRDEKVQHAVQAQGRACHDFKDHVVFEFPEIVTQQKQPYRVFTPYKRAWLAALEPAHTIELRPDLKRLASRQQAAPHAWDWDLEKIGFQPNALWLKAGEPAARARLDRFLKHIDRYHEQRDFPAQPVGTSGLSVHLRFGTVSIRRLVRAARKRDGEGARVWLSELIWRDFYQTILDRFPHVVGSCFHPQFDRVRWRGKPEHFDLWCVGKTGYPLVDAAMRLFRQTGWMHNRLRMVVASFLTKDLLIDWKKGEAWFARHLLDFDLAANNGGWQWCASTGCDAQPWFRIFNPVNQSKKFDPQGAFIRKHVPELAGFPDKRIHFPAAASDREQKQAGCLIGVDYPAPIVDHAVQRQTALEMFKAV